MYPPAYSGFRNPTILLLPNIKLLYKMISCATGSLGGNADGGAIYGEMTAISMQRIINLMKCRTNLNEQSLFIDIGSGLGKPNLHVALDTNVLFSCGVEIQRIRWMLSLHNFKQILQSQNENVDSYNNNKLASRCFFINRDIEEAFTLNPFTHVYMYNIGFTPQLMGNLSEIFNRSSSVYLICYHPPSEIIGRYKFNVFFLCKQKTSMHGSGEIHTGYFYKRLDTQTTRNCNIPCDPMFLEPWNTVKRGLEEVRRIVLNTLDSEMNAPRNKRSILTLK